MLLLLLLLLRPGGGARPGGALGARLLGADGMALAPVGVKEPFWRSFENFSLCGLR